MTDGQLADLRAVVDLLGDIEERHPVAAWEVDGLAVWPLVRARLGYALTFAVAGAEARSWGVGRGEVVRAAVASVRAGILPVGDSRWTGSDQARAVFLGDGLSYQRTGGRWFDRHCDPLRSALVAAGHPSLLVVARARPPRPMLEPARFIRPSLDVIRMRVRAGRLPALSLPGYDAVRSDVARVSPATGLLDRAVIGYAGATIARSAMWFEQRLRRCDAAIGFCVEWYALTSMAFSLACHRLGLPVVELQHGALSPLHFAYGSWRSLPAEGYDLLPSWFWVWGDEERTTIESWAPAPAHRVVVGGNLHMSYPRWDGGTVGATGASMTVLITLHGDESDRDRSWWRSVVEASPRSWRWLVRCHPKARVVASWETSLAEAGHEIDVAQATDAPLPAVLRASDVHVTYYSGVVEDAVELGVPSVVTTGTGAELFQSAIAAGIAAAEISAEPSRVVEAIEEAAARPRPPRAGSGSAWPVPGVAWALALLGSKAA